VLVCVMGLAVGVGLGSGCWACLWAGCDEGETRSSGHGVSA
jgi:hypothetical protein